MTVPQVILITGASSGVGHSLVSHLCERFHVIAVARRHEKMTEAFSNDPRVECHRVDVGSRAELEGFLGDLLKRHEAIPYLINNAGILLRSPLAELGVEDLERSMAVNAVAPYIILNALLPGMRRQGFGRVINLTSGAPFNCFPGFAAYSASKGALNALTITAAKENVDKDIKINLMSPGPVKSEMALDAPMQPSACHPTVDHLLSLPSDGATGRFFWLGRELPLSPDFDGVQWLAGTASDRFPLVI
jgi:NAD(P)-dependent dehydrogenase (short-subunit alcohol dehydrogenase family)